MKKELKKVLKKKQKHYKNVMLYATSESTVNHWCTDTSGSTTRIFDQGTTRCT